MAEPLALANLASLSGRARVPSYRRGDLSPGILHFGVGNFHRAHQGVYLDRLFNEGEAHDWALLGAGVMPGDAEMRAALAGQDWLTTVVEQSAEASDARVTGPMVDFLPVADIEATIAALSDPAIRIVSLTVTEGGYFIDPASGAFDPAHPDIRADVARPEQPRSVFGLIVAGLRARRAANVPPFTVLSCDNLPGNGKVARATIVGLAGLMDPALADWIQGEVAFPNAMVDRITPATGDRERQVVRDDFGISDARPVFCEDFSQWVLEDHFPAGRPPLEAVGVTFVADVEPYEAMKIRILNGGHALIAYAAGLMDIGFAHEAMQDELVRSFFAKVERTEILPGVRPVPETSLEDYLRLVERRFANPKIADTIRRLCLDGSNRQPKFIIPTIAERLRDGLAVDGLALESALWCRYCYGVTESGAEIEANDPNWERLTAAAQTAKADPCAWLEMADIYGETAAAAPFRERFASWLQALWRDGTETVLRRYLAGT